MGISLRSMLIAGTTAVAVSAIAIAPVRVTPEDRAAQVSAPVHLTAAVTPLTPREVSSAMAEISPIAPALNLPLAAGDVSTQNAASNVVDSVYDAILYWADYLALDLAPYVLGWLPGGWLITDQIYALYPPIIDFTDSVVYDLIDPVLNDPLNLEVWVNGISAVGYTAVASLINAGINEVNLVIDYFLGWLPPLPPLPPWPVSVAADTSVLAAAEATDDPPVDVDVPSPLNAIADSAATLAEGMQAEVKSQIDIVTDLVTEAAGVTSTANDDVAVGDDVSAEVIQEFATESTETAADGVDGPVEETQALADTAGTAVELDTEPDTAGKAAGRAENKVRAAVTDATDEVAESAEKATRTISQSVRDAADAATGKRQVETKESKDTKPDSSDSADTDKKSSDKKASDDD